MGGILGIDLLSVSGNLLQSDYVGNDINQDDINKADTANGYYVWVTATTRITTESSHFAGSSKTIPTCRSSVTSRLSSAPDRLVKS